MNVLTITFCLACALFCISKSDNLISEAHFFSLITEHENVVAMQCILNVMKKEIPCSTVVTLVYSNDDVNLLVETINNSECYTVIIRSFNDNNWLIKTDAYVIFTEDLQELAIGMSLITIDSFWNPRARIIAHAHDVTYDDINEAFKIFMIYRTYNVLFVTNSDTYDNAEIFTYFPFENGKCGKQFDDARLISFCNDISGVKDFFPNKFYNRMKNCTIRVLVSDDVPNIIIEEEGNTTKISGIEKYVLDNIAQIEGLRLEFEISAPPLGVVLPNHTAIGSLAKLQNNEVDIAAGGYILIQNRADIFDYLYGFNFASYNLYTAALDEPVWRTLYVGFDEMTWLYLFLSCLFIIIVAIIVLKFTPAVVYSYSDLMLNLWGYFYIGNGSKKLLNTPILKLIVICWIWLTFFMSSFFSTALYTLITAYVEPVYHIGPDNLASLPLKPCVSYHIRELFQYAYNHTLPENEYKEECYRTDSSLDFVVTRADLYAIAMTYSYGAREFRYIDDAGNKKLDAWIFSADNIVSIHMARGFPLRDKFQTLALQLYEGGFLSHQTDIYLQKARTAALTHPRIFRNIRLSDLEYHYCILLAGSILSTISFIIEIYTQKQKTRNRFKPKLILRPRKWGLFRN